MRSLWWRGKRSFRVLDKDLKKLLYTPNVYLVNLDLDGKSYGAVMRDIQFTR